MKLQEIPRGTAVYRITWIDATEEVAVYDDDSFWRRRMNRNSLNDIANIELITDDSTVAREMLEKARFKVM